MLTMRGTGKEIMTQAGKPLLAAPGPFMAGPSAHAGPSATLTGGFSLAGTLDAAKDPACPLAGMTAGIRNLSHVGKSARRHYGLHHAGVWKRRHHPWRHHGHGRQW